MSLEKTLYIITNISAISTITSMFGVLFYFEKDKKKTEFCIKVCIVSALVVSALVVITNIIEIMI